MRSRIKTWRWRRWLIVTVLGSVAGGVIVVTALAVIIIRYGMTDRAQPADVIIVLGGGEAGSERRTLHAAALYHRHYAPVLLCTGSAIIGQDFTEAAHCARVAQAQGVPAGAIVLEDTSLSTEENAIQAAALMQANGWQSAVLVSDDFHLWRATWLFERENVRVWPSPAQDTTGPLTRSEKAYAILREIAAVGWHVGKSLLGLPYTRLGE